MPAAGISAPCLIRPPLPIIAGESRHRFVASRHTTPALVFEPAVSEAIHAPGAVRHRFDFGSVLFGPHERPARRSHSAAPSRDVYAVRHGIRDAAARSDD